MAYCSLQQNDNYKKYKSCYDKETLIRIAKAWNRFYPEKSIDTISKLTHRQLWNILNEKFKPICGDNDEICWVEKINLNNDTKVKDSLLPETPKEWLNNPHTWLTNFNIEDVMFQYEKVNPNFKFLGVYPVDFRSTEYNGSCLYKETCTLNMVELLKKGIQYIGMVINLDKQNEPGSHWVALFICIDPKQSCFGAYYYDSYSGNPPHTVEEFMKDLQKQAKQITLRVPFKLDFNKVRHQYGGSECGMFSMMFIIRWMDNIKKRAHVTMNDIVNVKITDDDVFKMRKVFFRPYYQFKKELYKEN